MLTTVAGLKVAMTAFYATPPRYLEAAENMGSGGSCHAAHQYPNNRWALLNATGLAGGLAN